MRNTCTEAVRRSTGFYAISVQDNFQPAFTCSKSAKETPEKKCKIYSKLTIKTPERRHDVGLVSLSLTLNRFHTLFWCFR